MNILIISIGSNIRFKTSILKAINKIKDISGVNILRVSPVFTSKGIGINTFKRFGNSSLIISVDKRSRCDIKKEFNSIEIEMGRVRDKKSYKKDRIIDIDIIEENHIMSIYEKIPFIKMRKRLTRVTYKI